MWLFSCRIRSDRGSVIIRVDVETKLLERLSLLQETDGDIAWSAGSVAPAPQQQLVCWPVASSSEERYQITLLVVVGISGADVFDCVMSSKQSHRGDGMLLGLGSSFVSTLTSPLYSGSSSSDTTHLSEISPITARNHQEPIANASEESTRERAGDEQAPVAIATLRQESSSDESVTTSEVQSQSIY